MRINSLKISTLIIISIFLLVCCGKKKNDNRIVSVTILPQKYFVERIAGDYLTVNVMVPPGMSPETADLNTGQLKNLYDSQIYFAIGYLPLETTHVYPVLQGKEDIQVVKHSDNIELIEGTCEHVHDHDHAHDHNHSHGVDPHIWVSLRYAEVMASEILAALSENYSEKAEDFRSNYEALKKDIDHISQKADSVLKSKEHRAFLIYHPALTYFAHDYDMEQISIEHEGKEPNPTHLKKIIDEVKEKNIRIIFIQSQFDINNAKSIADATGNSPIPIDPLNENWLEEMNNLIDIFAEYLN